MDIMLIDFDAKFSEHIKKWLDENKDSYKDLDEVELKMPVIYEKWLSTPQDFLSGKKPNEYFLDFTSEDLINLMMRYEAKKIGTPDSLLDAISLKKEEPLPYLADIVFGKSTFPKEADSSALKIMAINLINEIDGTKYIKEYIDYFMREDLDEGVAECITDTIKQNANGYKNALISALENTDSDYKKKMLVDILCTLSFDIKVYDEIISLFKSSSEKALYASYLGKYGNEDAIKVLTTALDWININYLDYIEIRNAIEELGGEVNHARGFEGDKYFESMKGLNDA
jgi:hypothetical protein